MALKIEVTNIDQTDRVEEVVFSAESGLLPVLSGRRPSTRHSLLSDSVVVLGHIAATLAAAKAILELFDLPRRKTEVAIEVKLENEETGEILTVSGKDSDEVKETVEAYFQGKGRQPD